MGNISQSDGDAGNKGRRNMLFGALIYGRHPLTDFPDCVGSTLKNELQIVGIGRIDVQPLILSFKYKESVYSVLLKDALNAKELIAALSEDDKSRLADLAKLKPIRPSFIEGGQKK